MNSHEVFNHIHQGCFAGTGAIVRLPQCQGSKPDGYGKISQCITTTKHSKAKTVCLFLGIYCSKMGPWTRPTKQPKARMCHVDISILVHLYKLEVMYYVHNIKKYVLWIPMVKQLLLCILRFNIHDSLGFVSIKDCVILHSIKGKMDLPCMIANTCISYQKH